jgi:hypothetical protein
MTQSFVVDTRVERTITIAVIWGHIEAATQVMGCPH